MTALPDEHPPGSPPSRSGGSPAVAAPAVTFASAGVPAALIAVLSGSGIVTPFPIQAATLPDALAGRDILGRGQTGSGKTLGFALPLVARLTDGFTSAGRPRGLVLVPTRELASQVQAVLAPLAHAADLTVTAIYGGVPQNLQVTALRNRADIVIATPGRLADLIGQGHCHLGDVEIAVLDEADQMADLGFLPAVRELLESTPADGQRMLFSATLDRAVDVLGRRFMNDPAQHTAGPTQAPAAMIHHLLTVTPADRTGVVTALTGGRGRSLVCTRTKQRAHQLARQLTQAGVPAGELHGDLTQSSRERNLAAFATGATRVMVATDIAARGIHVEGIDLVIHADSPAEHKAYLHRAGRTARAGAAGTVITLQTPAQAGEVRTMMRKARVVPLAATVTPQSALLRSISGDPLPPEKPSARSIPRPETAPAAPATGRSAVALSAAFRGRR